MQRVYSCDGFDCASCADKTEQYLNKDPRIVSSRIDYLGKKLYLDFKEKPLSVAQIKELIAEVEDDPIEIASLDVRETSYYCAGFDCAACAANAEEHLNSHERVQSATIDYVNKRLYIVETGEPLSIQEIKDIIAEVEDDPIEISVLEEAKPHKSHKVLFLSLRIAYCLLVFALCGFFFKDLYYVRLSLYISALLVIEYDILFKVVSNIVHLRNPLDEYLLIALASSGAFVLACLEYADKGKATSLGNEVFMVEEHFEAILVVLLWQLGEILQDIAVSSSSKAVASAVNKREETALLCLEEGVKIVAAKSLKKDDVVYVNADHVLPIDGEIIEGSGYIDTSSLTGESLPIEASEGTKVYAGTTLTSGEIKIKATHDYASSSSAKILDLITSSLQHKGSAERFITKFARIYTPVVFLIALAYILIAGPVTGAWKEAIYRGLEILVISCPCALIISVPMAYFASLGLAGKKGIVIKGAKYLDTLLHISDAVFDKTGTLTSGIFSIVDIHTVDDIDKTEFLMLLASLEKLSSHPIAKAFVAETSSLETKEVTHYESLPGLGVKGIINGQTYYAGNVRLMRQMGVQIDESSCPGVIVHLCDEKRYYGFVQLEDCVKHSSVAFIRNLKKKGIQTHILSGDRKDNVAAVAEVLGIDNYQGELFPEEKLSALEEVKVKADAGVIYVGDGANDAPSLALSDCGFALARLGSDLAVQEADVLLLNDDLESVNKTLKIASLCRKTIIINIVAALAVKLLVLVLATVLEKALPMEFAVLADTGVSVILTLHSLLLLRRKI